MNNEFEWRNEMRKLGGPLEPARDLWPTIAARIAAVSESGATSTRRRYLRWTAIAAALVIAAGAAFLVRHPSGSRPLEPIAEVPAPATDVPRAPALPSHAALDWDVPDDPTLARTAANLDLASAQLQDALEQRPDAVFLVGLLNRTNSMRLHLLRKSPDAG